MGNYCCSLDQTKQAKTYLKKRKVSLDDPFEKANYELLILEALKKAVIKPNEDVEITQFNILSVLGKGSQGLVFSVQITKKLPTGEEIKQLCAMKRVSKKKLLNSSTKQCLLLQQKIMEQNRSQFMTRLQYAFQDKAYMYDIMEVAEGGDLFSYFLMNGTVTQGRKIFQEDVIKFLLAGIILALDQLHKRDIIFRDLKPQNILIYGDGYPKLTDFGVCVKKKDKKLCYDIKGTLLYLSPEMQLRRGYDRSHDLWSLGILAYQLIFLELPFSESAIKSSFFFQLVEKWQKHPHYRETDTSIESIDFVKNLLRANPRDRLGYNSISELKSHPFYNGFDWESYESKKMISPFVQLISLHQNLPSEYELNQTIEEGQIQSLTLIDFPFYSDKNKNDRLKSTKITLNESEYDSGERSLF